MEACAEAYEKQTGTRIRMTAGTTELGIEATASGAADMGGTSRPMLVSDVPDARDLRLAIVGWDALAVVVHPSNPTNNITREELIGIYQRKLTSWQELGGPNVPLILVGRQAASNHDNFSFRQLVCRDFNTPLQPAVIRLTTSSQVEELVERQPLTIAVTGISSARKRRLKVLSIDGHQPTQQAIAEGEYPFYRPLYVVYRPGAKPEVDQFVSWLLSEQGQQVIEAEGTVSLRQGSQLIRDYAYLPAGCQIENLDMLRRQAMPVFANEASR